MLGGIRHGKSSLASQILHIAPTLGEQLEQFEAVGAADRLPDSGKLLVELVLEESMVDHQVDCPLNCSISRNGPDEAAQSRLTAEMSTPWVPNSAALEADGASEKTS